MEPAIVVVLLWLLFGGTHILLATGAVRTRLLPRLGEVGFVGFFSLIASLTLWALIAYYAAHRFDGVAGLDAGAVPLMRWLLMGVIAVGFALMVAGLAAYPRMPMALFGQPIQAPRGIEVVTRHPFFAGSALVGIAHALLAPHLAGAVLMGGFAVLALAGARHQDARNLRTRGAPYADYLAATSTLPFAAILAGRQRLVWRELPLGTLAGGVAAAAVVRLAHASLFAGGGRWLVLSLVVGGAFASLQTWLRARRMARRAVPTPLQEVRG